MARAQTKDPVQVGIRRFRAIRPPDSSYDWHDDENTHGIWLREQHRAAEMRARVERGRARL
jgi:hypothetical protein